MRDFLDSLRSDLFDRRFLPVLALLGVALAAALAYTVLGAGGSSTSATPAPVVGASAGATGSTGTIAISQAPAGSTKAIAETTSGSSPHSGKARNPFTALPSTKAKTATSSSSSSTSTSGAAGASSSAGSGGSPSGSVVRVTAPKPVAPAKKVYIHFHVTAQFGVVPAVVAGTPPQPTVLKTYTNMPLDEPLPGKDNPQAVYLGVVLSTGNEAVFGLTGEAILHGSATCKPSATQCQAIALKIGQSETLEVVEADGQPVTYELKLLSIAKSIGKASAARAHVSRAQAKAARTARASLSRAGLSALAARYSTEKGIVRGGK